MLTKYYYIVLSKKNKTKTRRQCHRKANLLWKQTDNKKQKQFKIHYNT